MVGTEGAARCTVRCKALRFTILSILKKCKQALPLAKTRISVYLVIGDSTILYDIDRLVFFAFFLLRYAPFTSIFLVVGIL